MKIKIEKDSNGVHTIYDESGNILPTHMKSRNEFIFDIWDVYVSDQGLTRGFYVGEWYRNTGTLNVTNLQLEII